MLLNRIKSFLIVLKFQMLRLSYKRIRAGDVIYIAEVGSGYSRMFVESDVNYFGVIEIRASLAESKTRVAVARIGLKNSCASSTIMTFSKAKHAISFLESRSEDVQPCKSTLLITRCDVFNTNEFFYVWEQILKECPGYDFDGDLCVINGIRYYHNFVTSVATRVIDNPVR